MLSVTLPQIFAINSYLMCWVQHDMVVLYNFLAPFLNKYWSFTENTPEAFCFCPRDESQLGSWDGWTAQSWRKVVRETKSPHEFLPKDLSSESDKSLWLACNGTTLFLYPRQQSLLISLAGSRTASFQHTCYQISAESQATVRPAKIIGRKKPSYFLSQSKQVWSETESIPISNNDE